MDAVVGPESPAEPAEDGKDWQQAKDGRRPGAQVPPRRPARQGLEFFPQENQGRRQEDDAGQPGKQIVFPDRRVQNGRRVVLQAIHEHHAEGLVENAVIGNADHEQEGQDRQNQAVDGKTDLRGRPGRPERAGKGRQQEGKARQEGRRLQADPQPQEQGVPDLPRRDNAELSPEEEQEHDAKDHQNKFQEDEKPYILLQQTKKTFHRRQGSFARNDRNAVWGRMSYPKV